MIVQGVCKILELAVPLMNRPSETFLASLEKELMSLILTHHFSIIVSAIACLSAIVTSFTHNYKLVWECFEKMGGELLLLSFTWYLFCGVHVCNLGFST